MELIKHNALKIHEDTTTICRDHLRNVCQRGDRCKFTHVNLEDLDHLVDTNKDPTSHNCEYVFCHNFQNKGCTWSQCKFIHCSKAIEDNYKNNGLLPLRLKYEFEFGVHELCIGISSASEDKNDKPICRSFLKGECHRGSSCRFLHSSNKLTDDDKRANIAVKRTWGQMSDSDTNANDASLNTTMPISFHEGLQGENNFLRQQVNELKKQVSNLTATNEFLLEQNAKFRYGNKQAQNNETYASASISQEPIIASGNLMSAPSQSSRQVPVAITFSMAGQNPQVCTNETTHILTADNQGVISANDLVNSPAQQQRNNVGRQTHNGALTPQNHLPINRSIAPPIVPNTVTLNSTVQINNSIISQSNTTGNVQQQLHSNIATVHGINQHAVTLQPTSFHVSLPHNSIQHAQSMAYSVTSQSINNPLSSIASVNQLPSTILAAAGSLAATNSVPLQALNQSMPQSSQNITVAGGLVSNITVQTDNENMLHANQNINQVAHRQTLVANNQQNQTSGTRLTGGAIPGSMSGGIPGSMAAVAVQVVAQGSMAQTNGFHRAPLSSAIIPVSIATSHQMSALVNSANIVVQPPAPGVSISTSAPNAMASISGGQHPQVPSLSMGDRRMVANPMSSPITYTITPSGNVQQQCG